jgi:hypothetical protein
MGAKVEKYRLRVFRVIMNEFLLLFIITGGVGLSP